MPAVGGTAQAGHRLRACRTSWSCSPHPSWCCHRVSERPVPLFSQLLRDCTMSEHTHCCIHLLRRESLDQKQAVWNTVTVDKAFYESVDGRFIRSLVCREGKSVPRVSAHPVRTKQCSLHGGNGPVSSTCQQAAVLSPWGMGPYEGPSVGP